LVLEEIVERLLGDEEEHTLSQSSSERASRSPKVENFVHPYVSMLVFSQLAIRSSHQCHVVSSLKYYTDAE